MRLDNQIDSKICDTRNMGMYFIILIYKFFFFFFFDWYSAAEQSSLCWVGTGPDLNVFTLNYSGNSLTNSDSKLNLTSTSWIIDVSSTIEIKIPVIIVGFLIDCNQCHVAIFSIIQTSLFRLSIHLQKDRFSVNIYFCIWIKLGYLLEIK